MKTRYIYIVLAVILFCAHSCKKESVNDVDENLLPIVTIKDKTLYRADLKDALPIGISGEDSINAAHAYIDTWINEQLMYDKAQQNIVNKNDIEDLVNSYRRSLITNSYQEQLLKEHFSTSVSEKELSNYYEQNKDKFKLEENIIKGLYLKIPLTSKELNNFLKWYKQGTDASIEYIEKNTLQNAVGYEYFYDRWVSLDEVMENIPAIVRDGQLFLKTNNNLEIRDSTFVYLLNIKEYKLSGSEAPYQYIKGHLSEIFMEQRKGDYMKQVRKDLYDKAISNKEIKFYEK